jgi:S1-C subfamily serine protease
VGDVITTIDGVAVSHGDALVEATLTKAPGDQVTLGYLRSGTPGTATVTLA